jgi:hypothetical protein
MTLRTPLPIEETERNLAQGSGIEPGDLAPCLKQPEVWVRGHAWYPAARGAPSVRVRLAVARGATLLLRKNVEIPVQNDPFVAPYLHALAPLSRAWPVRTRLLGAFDWTDLDRTPLKLPEVFDWTFFQAAAADQRLDVLHGDEWIRLEAMHSTILKFDTQLPSATCAVMMFGGKERDRQGAPISMRLDTVQIDVDQGSCALVFRGHIELAADVRLEFLQFLAALGLPNRPMPALDQHLRADAHDLTPLEEEEENAEILTTSFFDASILDATLRPGPALPFQRGESALVQAAPEVRPAEPAPDAGQTFLFDAGVLAPLACRQALPFHQSSSESREVIAQDRAMAKPAEIEPIGYIEPVRLAPITHDNGLPLSMEKSSVKGVELDAGSTFFLSEEMLAALEGQEATPFVGGEPAAEREGEVDVLAGLPFARIGAEKADLEGTLGSIFLTLIAQVEQADQLRMGAH